MPEVNIKRIRNLDTENTMSDSLMFPVDSNSYGVEAKKVSMSAISNYIIGDLSLTGLTDVSFSNVQVNDILIYQGGGLWGITGYTSGSSAMPIIGDEPEILFRDDSATYKYNTSSGLTFDYDTLFVDAVVSITSGHSYGIGDNDTTMFKDQDNLVLGNQYDNVVLGSFSGVTGQRNIVGGFNISGGATKVPGNDNVIIGNEASIGSLSFDNSIKIGTYAGTNRDGDYNIVMGYASAYSSVSEPNDKNIYIGYYSGYAASGASNLSIGIQSGREHDGQDNTMVGYKAGYQLTGKDNLAVGMLAGSSSTLTRTAMFGEFAGGSATSKYSMFFGDTAGYASNGLRNLFVGYGTGREITGSNNIVIGYLGAKGITGHNNVIIGNYAEYEGGSMSNKLIVATTGSTADFGPTSPPHTAKELIYGEFDNYYLRMNAHVKINQILELEPVNSGTTVDNSFFVDIITGDLMWTDNSGITRKVTLT